MVESLSAAEVERLVRRGAGSTVAGLFLMQARLYPDRIALVDGDHRLTYAELGRRATALAGWLQCQGVGQGTRVAILSENRLEYLELFLAAGWIGAIVACQNWRLAAPELAHCLALAEPEVILVSPRHADRLSTDGAGIPTVLTFGAEYEAALTATDAKLMPAEFNPESPLLILYTSGTTGLPKAP